MHTPIKILVLLVSTLTLTQEALAQWDFKIPGFSRNNSNQQNLNPSVTNPSLTISECWSAGIPWTRGVLGVQLTTSGTFFDGITGNVQIQAPTTPEDMLNWTVNQSNVVQLSPPTIIGPCPPTGVYDYGRLTGNQDVYSFSIGGLFGGAPVIVKKFESEMTWTDTLTITSATAQTISLAVGSLGSILAAESFGSSVTEARADLTVTGSIGPATVSDSVQVVSASTIPVQASLNSNRLLQIPLVAGVNTIPVQLSAKANVKATAQGAGIIAGSATAGVQFPNGLSFGPFLDANGGPLQNDILIVSAMNNTIYEDTTRNARWARVGYSVGGTAGAPQLVGSGPLTANQPVQLDVSQANPNAPAVMAIGLAAGFTPYLGGWIVPDLSRPSSVSTFATDAAGQATFSFVAPPGLPAGFEAYYQAWVYDPSSANNFLSATNGVQSLTPR